MEKIKQLLKITSEYRFHPHNIAKEYALLENGEFLTLGRDCVYHKNQYLLRVETTEEFKIKLSHIEERYTLCYGISLTNIVSILANKKVLVIGINTYKDSIQNRKYVITLQKENRLRAESFYFSEEQTLEDFESSELGHFMCDLYDL